MNFKIKVILLCLLLLSSLFVINAQEERSLPPNQSVENEWECGLTTPPLIQFNISVWSNKNGYLKNLTYKDFEVYDEKELREIEFFKFNELKNQYTIGFYQKYPMQDNKWRKIKVNLLKEKRKDYGKILIKTQSGYYPNQN